MNFYKSAALALDHLEKHQGSVKGSLSAAGVQGTGGETKRILALVIETLKYRPVIQEILTKVPILTLEKITFPRKTPPKAPSSASLVLVLLHDLLFSSKTKIEASDMWPPKPAVMKHQARLRAELVRIQIKQGKQSKSELARTTDTDGMVRYIRWNPNTDLHRSGDWSLPALIKHLQAKGYTQLPEPVYPVPVNKWFMDLHLDDCLLVFESGTTWWQGDEWYESGAVILQDKASCFPAKVLMDRWISGEGECLDATAAPGNKTSYISALMGDQGQLYAFERSQGRFKTLEKMLSRANCENVKAHCGDFLAADPGDRKYKNVTRILLDPSCSGSGIVNRLDYLVEDENAEETDAKAERLEKLAAFQLQMVIHAFRFASAKRIVYSTCSIHPEEDEQVVMKALASPFAKKNGWVLAPRSAVLPKWERRGRPEETAGKQDLADSVIRCVAGEDKTNGFFVACFVRKGSDVFNEPEPSSETGDKKRPREEDVELAETDEMDFAEDAEKEDGVKQSKPPKEKTAAQLARNKRKKQKQKAK